MSSRSWLGCLGAVVIVLVCGAQLGTAVTAQAPTRAANSGEIASDPIKCWWKTGTSALLIGERFMLTLTCGVIEAGRVVVIPKMDQLDPAALQLSPFEVLDGVRHEDIGAPPWRYFQYDYTLRLVGPEFFGQDVDVPALTITYNIQSVADAAAGLPTQGRDQRYLLPALPLRVASLVPKAAIDIRDAPRETFADVEARRLRANIELVAATILFSFAAMMLAFAAVRLVRHGRERAPTLAPSMPAATVLQACLREIGRLTSEVARDGWTPERAGSALTVLRIGTAFAIREPVAQALVDTSVPAREGQLALRKGIFRRKRVLVSAPITSDAIDRYRINENGRAPSGRTQAMLEDLGESFRSLSAARYGRNGNLDTAVLDRALENGRAALRRLRLATLWPMRAADTLARSAATLVSLVWTR